MLKLGDFYQAPTLVDYAIHALEQHSAFSPLLRLHLARSYGVHQWIEPAFRQLINIPLLSLWSKTYLSARCPLSGYNPRFCKCAPILQCSLTLVLDVFDGMWVVTRSEPTVVLPLARLKPTEPPSRATILSQPSHNFGSAHVTKLLTQERLLSGS